MGFTVSQARSLDSRGRQERNLEERLMAWVLGAVTALALSLAFTAHADEQLGVRAEAPPVVVVDSTLEPPEVPRISSRVRKDWLEALAYKVERARSALQEHRLVVTSGDREVRRYTYDDLAKSLDPAEAKLAAAVAAADAPKSRIDLSLPEKPNRNGDLKFELTGGVDTVGVLLSKKM
jgi:hypothetical protein